MFVAASFQPMAASFNQVASHKCVFYFSVINLHWLETLDCESCFGSEHIHEKLALALDMWAEAGS